MPESKPKLEPGWLEQLEEEFQKDYMINLKAFLKKELSAQRVYPPASLMFEAFNRTPFNKIRLVILGQDPYHGEGQAHGLCFSVPQGIPQPPSLKNILKELQSDLGLTPPSHGCLNHWADQGVFLLNTTLSVVAHRAKSHFGRGWETFTDKVIQTISQEHQNIVFLLWGSPAGQKSSLIDSSKHLILKAPHPSPLSASRGFFGCKHFSKANHFLIEKGLDPIDWQLSI